MLCLLNQLQKDKSLINVKNFINSQANEYYLHGINGSQKHTIISLTISQNNLPTIILCPHKEALEEWYNDLSFLCPDIPILELPSLDLFATTNNVGSISLRSKRMEILTKFCKKERCIILATGESVLNKEISKDIFTQLILEIQTGKTTDIQELQYNIANLGYEKVGKIDTRGQFSKRGGIIDIFPIASNTPIRIEFFDNEIESIREFDITSQRSEKNLNSIIIPPILKPKSAKAEDSVFDYLPENSLIIMDEPIHLKDNVNKLIKENIELKQKIFSFDYIKKSAQKFNLIYVSLMQQRMINLPPEKHLAILSKPIIPFQRQMSLLCTELRHWQKNNQQIIIILSNQEKLQYLKNYLQEANFQVTTNENELVKENFILLTTGILSNGFELPCSKLVLITEKDILGRQKKRIRHSAPKENRIHHFRDIKIGDYVVHITYGIGKYMGIETLTIDNIHRDYLFIKFAGTDKLFLPTDKVNLLQKYIGNEDNTPTLSKLNSLAWKKATAKAKKSVENIAKELVKLYAQRKKIEGFSFSEDTPWQKEFEDAFPFEETKDQLRCIKEIKKDMESPVPMERLLCGDVGFGKTEVAMRAAFKAVMDNKQVAVLVPTTVLAQQHFQTFKQRFEGFGPNIAILSRFTTIKEQKNLLKDLEAGKIDIILGTHALLNNKKVIFKDLGLLIIDEEQRFGVKQKEKIKTLAQNVDVLSLSATPIPRTLHMSLAGARDMSVIETPPNERLPVQTYVIENNDLVLADAIKRELRRGGQVYFIYNRVETMDKIYLKLSSLIPNANIAMAHGRMSENELERAMLEFYEGKKDILLATSIVENGLDVSNANTIIIYDADHFGLSQLYQMRGRVGRSTVMAFAYFVYRQDKILSEVAEKRLQAIKEFAELGAGFKIAMRDLEIRGAGDILGAQQHGHIASVGFEMYCQLLEDAMTKLKYGKELTKNVIPNIELKVDAFIDEKYISDSTNKIEVYQRLLGLRTVEQLDTFKEELQDRFGNFSLPVQNLLEVSKIRIYATQLSCKEIIQKRGDFLDLTFLDTSTLNLNNVVKLQKIHGNNLRILDEINTISIKLTSITKNKILDITIHALELLLKS